MKIRLQKLKNTLLYKYLLSQYHLIAFALIGGLIVVNKPGMVVTIVFLGYLVYLGCKSKQLLIIAGIITLLAIGNLLIRNSQHERLNKLEQITATGTVIEKVKRDMNFQLYLKTSKGKYLMYTDEEYEVGDTLLVNAKITKAFPEHYKGGFDYEDYLKHQSINGILKCDKIEKVGSSFSLAIIKAKIEKYFELVFPTIHSFLKTLLLGSKHALNDELATSIKEIGISHLFVVSGLHVSMLLLILEKTIIKIPLIKRKNIVKLIFLIGYVIITNFLISVIRVVLTEILKIINKKLDLQFTSVDLLMLNIILVLVVNPYILFQMSFILSYLIAGTFCIASLNVLKKPIFSKKVIGPLLITPLVMSAVATLITLPIIINIDNEINVLSLIYNIFYIPIISYLFLPLAIVVVVIPPLAPLLSFLINAFSFVTIYLGNIPLGKIAFPTIGSFGCLIYYYLFIRVLMGVETKQKVRFSTSLMLLYLVVWHFLGYCNIYDEVVFMDLPVGEATLIRGSFNRYNVLIDTGDIPKNNESAVTSYLQSIGVKTIDCLFITHSDADHIGGLASICSELKVKQIYFNYYEHSKNLPKIAGIRVAYLKKGDRLMLGGKTCPIDIKVLAPFKQHLDINNNSLVMLVEVNGLKMLMMGDAEKEVEEIMTAKYQHLSFHILKVGHHGSNTSTSADFLKTLDFQYAIIMNGYQNIHGFPSNHILKRLANKTVFTTGFTQTIIFRKLFFQKNYYLAS